MWRWRSSGNGGISMPEAVIALGSNLGDRWARLGEAVDALSRLPKTEVLAISPYYETEPFECPEPQENYLNGCVRVRTGLAPHVLLGACLGIEAAMGKVRTHRNAPRVIDLDVLLYEGFACEDADLIVPHPRLLQRAFVMVPLLELFPSGRALGLEFGAALARVGGAGVWPAYQQQR